MFGSPVMVTQIGTTFFFGRSPRWSSTCFWPQAFPDLLSQLVLNLLLHVTYRKYKENIWYTLPVINNKLLRKSKNTFTHTGNVVQPNVGLLQLAALIVNYTQSRSRLCLKFRSLNYLFITIDIAADDKSIRIVQKFVKSILSHCPKYCAMLRFSAVGWKIVDSHYIIQWYMSFWFIRVKECVLTLLGLGAWIKTKYDYIESQQLTISVLDFDIYICLFRKSSAGLFLCYWIDETHLSSEVNKTMH